MSGAGPFSAVPGAVLRGDCIAHYGAPLREQRAFTERGAVVDAPGLRVLTLTGSDRLTWLDSITSQRVRDLAPGDSTELLSLSPQGQIEASALVADDGDTLWLLVEAEDAPGLADFLTRMRFRADVKLAVRDDLFVIARHADAPRLDGALAEVLDDWSTVRPGGVQYAARPGEGPVVADASERPPGVASAVDPGTAALAGRALSSADPHAGWRVRYTIVSDGRRAELASDVIEGRLRVAGVEALEALRIAAWRPHRLDLDERALPHEVDWLRTAVHLDKGCYRGQETVAKVHNLGHPPRRLVMLHLDGSDSVLPQPGDALVREGEDAQCGRILASAMHHELGFIALALVKRTLPVDAPLEAIAEVRGATGEPTGTLRIPAAQEVIVPPDAGRANEVPRMPRLGRRPARQAPEGPRSRA